MSNRSVLTISPDRAIQRHLADLLRHWGYESVPAASVDEAIAALVRDRFLLTLLDVAAMAGNGSAFMRRLEIQGADPGPIIILSNGGDVDHTAETASRLADDFLPKPFLPEDLENVIKEALSRPRRVWRSEDDPEARLQQEIALWRSPRMQTVWDIVQQVARVDVTVLICGETGTGKDVAARAIHRLSPRQDRPFIKVNCAAVPRELLESELFGHERGAFTGAYNLKIGKFESANHGTIFLDEIGDLHPALQAKLLHVLQDGTFSRVGAKTTLKVDVRVLAATNQDLERAVAEGRFRDDLYYRLNVVQILVPPLRERAEEIPGLVEYFVQRYARLFKRQGFALDGTTISRLIRHRYPGNVRELENVIKRMIVLNDPMMVKTTMAVDPPADDPVPPPVVASGESLSLKEIGRKAARSAEREAIARVLEQTAWNRTRAAKQLKISYRALLYKIKDVGLDRSGSALRQGIP